MSDEYLQSWPSGGRDTTEWPQVRVSVDHQFREHLNELINLDGVGWNDFKSMDSRVGASRTPERWRTYRVMYSRLGLIGESNGCISLSPLGQAIRDLPKSFESRGREVEKELAKMAAAVLVRYQLNNPVDKFSGLPPDCDVRPYAALWMAALDLEGKLHWHELNRVLLRVMRMEQLAPAIEKVRRARAELGGSYSGAPESRLDDLLGKPVTTDQAAARMAPWFSAAGWGGLLISRDADDDGFRNLTVVGKEILPSMLREQAPSFTGASPEEWTQYYLEPLSRVIHAHSEANSSQPLELGGIVETFQKHATDCALQLNEDYPLRVAASLLSKRFLILSGLAGSGKTKMAQAFARWITPRSRIDDPFVPGTKFESDRVTYVVKKSDSVGVEFWNEGGDEGPTKNMVPREVISEWADYIQTHGIHEDVSAQAISEAVEPISAFSAYLHRFRPFLKLAAFALIKARTAAAPIKCYDVIPVGADWAGNENILGYPDGLQASHYVAKPALQLILQAAGQAAVPHFLILDEMNLSHVERYFADLLSVIESDEGLELYSGDMEKPDTWRKTSEGLPVPPRLKQLPSNLFVVGTVNVDETTYMFSPKVLDRANVIEFRTDASGMDSFLRDLAKPDLSQLDGKGESFGGAFVNSAMRPAVAFPDVKPVYDAELVLLFKTLQTHGAEFGYRTAYETARFVHFYKLLGNHQDGDTTWFTRAFDCVIFQKLLPKLHGSRVKLGPVLKKLWFLCVTPHKVDAETSEARDELIAATIEAAEEAARSTDKKAEPTVAVPGGAPYPLSAEKIGRMWRLLMENGFASFAEA